LALQLEDLLFSARNWDLIERILRGEPWLPPIGKLVEGEFHSFRDPVRFPSRLAPLIEIRWRELGYENLHTSSTAKGEKVR